MNIIAKEVSIMRLRTKSISIVIEDQVSPEYRSCSLPVEASAGLGLQEPLLPLLRSTKGIIRLEWFAGPGRTGGGGGLTRYRTLTVQLPVHTGCIVHSHQVNLNHIHSLLCNYSRSREKALVPGIHHWP